MSISKTIHVNTEELQMIIVLRPFSEVFFCDVNDYRHFAKMAIVVDIEHEKAYETF